MALVDRERRDAARVDDAFDAGAQRFFHDDARTIDVRSNEFGRHGRPETVVGGAMDEVAHALESCRNGCTLAQIADRDVVAGAKIATVRSRAG